MHLPLSSAAVPRLVVVDECTSTNDLLVASAAQEPDLSVLVTDRQTAGRGRLRREWIAPAGESLAISVLVRPVTADGVPLEPARFGWMPLLAGLAMARAVASVVPADRVGLKWPNDVQIDGLKVSGVLAEVAGTGDAIVVGAGVNLAIPADRLPTPVSTSLVVAGAEERGDALADAVLSAYLLAFRALYSALLAHGGDAVSSGLLADVRHACTTLGREVAVELPDGTTLRGVATGIDASGRLEVRSSADGRTSSLSVGDVTHVRPLA